jgi:UDP-2-acetamido-3-amino-2,3-dideoxy-glucuronate N-acetyltransferase
VTPSGNGQGKLILAGAGYWGKNLVRNFYDLGVLQAIVDANEPVLEERRSQYPTIAVYKDYDVALREVDAQAVVISTPAALHYTMVRLALEAGKDVYVEKPLALSVEEGSDLVDLAQKNDRILFVGHILHYHPGVVKIKRMVDEGAIGRLQYIYSNRLNLGKIRREENILWSFAPHDISLILSLVAEDPHFVDATGHNFLHPKIADTTMTNFKFPSGVGAHIYVSWLHPFKEQRLVIVGSEGMLVFEDTLPVQEKVILYPHRIDWRRGEPVPQKMEGQPVPLEDTWIEPLRAECTAFLQSVNLHVTPMTDGREGLRVLRVLHACQESLDREIRNFTPVETRKAQRTLTPGKLGSMKNAFFSHETSVVDENVQIGKGTKIWHFSHILKDSTIGENCNIGQNVVIGPRVRVGDRCKIQNNVSIYEGVTLEDEVFCGPSMVFTNVFNPRASIARMKELKPTHVGRGATIGANATIVCGNRIGKYAFIGAGAVVARDVPDFALVVGNPAKIIGWMCKCGVKINFNESRGLCEACGERYRMEVGKVISEGEEP